MGDNGKEGRHVALSHARTHLSDFGIAFDGDTAVAQPGRDETGPEHVAGFVDGDHGEHRGGRVCRRELASGGASPWTSVCSRGRGDVRAGTCIALVGDYHARPIFYSGCDNPERPRPGRPRAIRPGTASIIYRRAPGLYRVCVVTQELDGFGGNSRTDFRG